MHFVAAALLIARPLLILKVLNIVLAPRALRSVLLHHEFFNTPPATIVGFMTFKPRTEDYVPLFPWIGVVSLLGAGLAATWPTRAMAHSTVADAADERAPRWLFFSAPGADYLSRASADLAWAR